MTPLAWAAWIAGWIVWTVLTVGVGVFIAWLVMVGIPRIAPPGRNLLDPPAQPCPKCDRAITHVVGRDHNHWTYSCQCGQQFTGPRRFHVEGMG